MNLIEAFEKKLVKGLGAKHWDRVIETIISKIFFYKEKVYKVYKYGKFFFGDFSNNKFREDFYKEDFYWNNITAPKIYLGLKGVEKIGDEYKITEESCAEDFFIEMQKFDDNKNLTNLLLNKQIAKKELAEITKEITSRLKKLTASKKEKYKNYFKNKLLDIQLADLESDRNLLYLIQSYVVKEKTDKIINLAKKASIDNSYYLDYDPNNLFVLIDNHSDNIVFLNDKVQFIDVLPPKESWRVGDLNFCICRLATDVAVLGSQELADAVYNNCESMPEKIKSIYEIRSALIQTWCFYSADRLDIAEKYLKFAEQRAQALTNGHL